MKLLPAQYMAPCPYITNDLLGPSVLTHCVRGSQVDSTHQPDHKYNSQNGTLDSSIFIQVL